MMLVLTIESGASILSINISIVNTNIMAFNAALLGIFFLNNILCEPLLDPAAVAEAGTVIAEASADYVVDLLCGCGCRFVDVKTCVPDTKKICKDIVKSKCVTKDKVECKDEYKKECKTVYKDVCHTEKKKECKTEYKEVCKPVYKPPTYAAPAYHGNDCKKVPEEKCARIKVPKCLTIPEETCRDIPTKDCKEVPTLTPTKKSVKECQRCETYEDLVIDITYEKSCQRHK